MTWILVPVTVVGIIISLSILTESKSSIVEREFEEFKEFDEYEDNMDKDDFYEDDYDEEYYDENGEKYYLYRISDVFKDPKPRNPRGMTSTFNSPTRTRPRELIPDQNPKPDIQNPKPRQFQICM